MSQAAFSVEIDRLCVSLFGKQLPEGSAVGLWRTRFASQNPLSRNVAMCRHAHPG